jgi:hypothetical protein
MARRDICCGCARAAGSRAKRTSKKIYECAPSWPDLSQVGSCRLPLSEAVFGEGLVNIPRAAAFAATLLLIVTMVARRPPVRVTPNPLFWLLAFVVTYGSFG